jgi:hypothetical protein
LGVLKERGLVGLVVYLGYYFYPIYLLLKGERALRAKSGTILSELAPGAVLTIHFALIAGILALVMNIAMSTFYSPFLQAFLWLWLGIGARSAMHVRDLADSLGEAGCHGRAVQCSRQGSLVGHAVGIVDWRSTLCRLQRYSDFKKRYVGHPSRSTYGWQPKIPLPNEFSTRG